MDLFNVVEQTKAADAPASCKADNIPSPDDDSGTWMTHLLDDLLLPFEAGGNQGEDRLQVSKHGR